METLSLAKKKIWIATGNAGKIKEIIPMIHQHLGAEFEILGRAPHDAIENGATFAANAWIKAHELSRELEAEGRHEFWVIADDSGLCVEALDGRPGLHSARYAGDHVDANAHIQKLLGELQDQGAVTLGSRRAHYHCSLALQHFSPEGKKEWLGEGRCDGYIGFDLKGAAGFGYDPVFYEPSSGRSFAEIPYEEKNAFSHRRRAFQDLEKKLFS